MLIIDGVVKNQKKNKEKLLKVFFCHHKSVTLVDSVTEVQNWTTQSTPPRMEHFSFLPEYIFISHHICKRVSSAVQLNFWFT